MVAFLEIDGSFNIVLPGEILRFLGKLGVETDSIDQAEDKDEMTHGGDLCPLLWIVVLLRMTLRF